MIKQIKKLLFDYTEVYDDKPIVQGLLLLIKDNYISKDKIKEEIEKREKQKEEVPHEMDFHAFYRISDLKEIEIGALKQLLEEENER